MPYLGQYYSDKDLRMALINLRGKEASEICWQNATINLIGRWDMLAKCNNPPLNK